MPLLAEMLTIGLIAITIAGVVWLFFSLNSYPIPLLGRVSLRRRSRALLSEDHRLALAQRRVRELGRRYPLLRVLPFVLLAGGVYLPAALPFLPSPGGTFADEKASKEFLETMWQVVAGALGLSVAMIAFAFEAFVSVSQRRLGGSLREFAADTWLLFAVQLGVTSLLLDGFVLLGYGCEAPAGWAAMWTTLLSAATLLSVVYVLDRVVRSLDVDELVQIRRRRLQLTVDEAMWHQLTSQVAEAVLRSYEEIGVERMLTAPRGGTVVRSRRSGRVRDVRIGILLRLVRHVRDADRKPKVGVIVELGRGISEGEELVALRPGAGWLEQWRARRAVRVRRGREAAPDRSLNDDLSRLHGQALAAARAGRADEWRPIGDLYEMVLLALPEAAKRIGVPFEGAIAAPGFFGYGPLQRIGGHVSDELKATLQADDGELASAISYLPNKVAREAMDSEAVQVAEEMLHAFPRMYWLSMRETEPRSGAAEVLLDRSTSHLFDLDYAVSKPIEEEPQGSKRRGEAAQLGRALFRQVNLILKSAIDIEDQKGFAETERRWAKMFEDEIAHHYEPPGREPPRDSFGSLDRYRSTLQFGLAMWAVHLLKPEVGDGEPRSKARIEAVSQLSAHFGGLEELSETFERASDRDDEDSVPWTGWFLSELPTDEAHSIPSSSSLMLTFLLLALERVEAGGDQELKPREWFETRRAEIEESIKRLREEGLAWSRVLEPTAASENLGEGDLEKRWNEKLERLEQMLESARNAAIEHRKAAEREAPLDSDLVEAFSASLIKASRESRSLRDLFATQGGLKGDRGLGQVPPRTSRIWLPKRLFIHGSRLVGGDRNGQEIGRRTRNAEMNRLMDLLKPTECVAAEENLSSQLTGLVAEMKDEGRPATLILLPISWRLRERLGLTMWGKQLVDSDLVPDERSEEFAGLFDDVPVLDSPWSPEDRIYLLNLPSLGTYVEGPSERDSGLRIDMRAFTEREAREFIEAHPEVKPKDSTEEEARLVLQESVLCEMVREWQIEAGEDPSVRSILVPQELRHNA